MLLSVKCDASLLSALLVFCLPTAFGQVEGEGQLAEGIGELSVHILQKLAVDGKNSIHSAYGISSALALCLFGAEGETYASIRHVLNLDQVADSDIPKVFRNVNKMMRKTEEVNSKSKVNSSLTMTVASALFANNSLQFNPDYLDTVQNVFEHTKIERVDFAGNAGKTQFKINSFVKTRTHGKIPSLLDRPIDRRTLLAIINAVYLKGTWKSALKTKSSDDSFNNFICRGSRVNPSTRVNWMMLQNKLHYGRSSEIHAHLLELPYESASNASVSMILVLPFDEFKCNVTKWVKEQFGWTKLREAMGKMFDTRIDLTLPKFKLESTYDIKNTLSSLGLDIAFWTRASFDRMLSEQNSASPISGFVHKAKMSVDELGTEAAAASGSFLKRRSPPLPSAPPVELVFNRSFLAMIVVNQKGSLFPLFTALVNKV